MHKKTVLLGDCCTRPFFSILFYIELELINIVAVALSYYLMGTTHSNRELESERAKSSLHHIRICYSHDSIDDKNLAKNIEGSLKKNHNYKCDLTNALDERKVTKDITCIVIAIMSDDFFNDKKCMWLL